MPTPQFPGVPDYDKNKSTEYNVRQLYDAYIGISRYLTYLLSALDTLNISRLDAKVVNTGVLNTNRVTIHAEDGNKYYQIDGSGIVANNGVENTLEFDLATGNLFIKGIITALAGLIGGWTISGNALVSSTNSYPRVVIDPTNRVLAFYSSASEYIGIGAFSNNNRPFLEFVNSGNHIKVDLDSNSFDIGVVGTTTDIEIVAGQDLTLSSARDIDMVPGRDVRVDFGRLYDPSRNKDLIDMLDEKADRDSAVNYLQYNSMTKELHAFDIDGNLLSTVTIV